MKERGLVFNIQRYSVHDGDGIRTIVFLKGCPLACPWCANPESRMGVVPTSWMKNGKCETIGEWWTVEALVDEILQDEIFFRTSGGGVTLSGGEVLMQHEFAAKLLQALQDLGVHTAIETTGCFPIERIKTLTPYLNQVLFDLKIMDEVQAKNVIGINVNQVKENFEYLLSQNQIDVIPRIPLIPEYTVKKANLEAIVAYLKSVHVFEVHLLPFHQYGSSKYQYLGWDYQMKDVATLTQDELVDICAIFASAGILTNIDGLE